MAKIQTRRSISVRGTTYDRLRDYTATASISMSDFIEQRIAEWFDAHPNAQAARPAQVVAAPAPRPAPARVAVARTERSPLPIRPLPAKSAVTLKPAPAPAPLRASAPPQKPVPARNAVGRPAPTPAAQIIKVRQTSTDRDDYRAIRF